MVKEINNHIIENINIPFDMFKSLLHHARKNITKQSIFKEYKEKLIIQLVEMEELKDEKNLGKI